GTQLLAVVADAPRFVPSSCPDRSAGLAGAASSWEEGRATAAVTGLVFLPNRGGPGSSFVGGAVRLLNWARLVARFWCVGRSSVVAARVLSSLLVMLTRPGGSGCGWPAASGAPRPARTRALPRPQRSARPRRAEPGRCRSSTRRLRRR